MIGKLRHPIIFRRLTATTPDGAGGTKAPVWTEYYRCFAQIEPKAHKRQDLYTQIITETDYHIMIHYPPVEIKVSDRIETPEGKILTIASVVNYMYQSQMCKLIASESR